jgi:hypothetical protein
MPKYNRMTKAEGLTRAAEELVAEYEIEPNPIEPGTKWKAQLGILRIPGLTLGVASLMACLIEYADEETGIAWPSEETIAEWSASSLRSIERAVPRAAELGLVKITQRELRGLKRGNIYLLNWDPFLNAFNRPRPSRRVTPNNTTRQSGGSAYRQSGGSGPAKVADDYSYLDTTLNETTVVRPPSVADTNVIVLPEGKKEKEGIQREEVVEGLSPHHKPPAEPSSSFNQDRVRNLRFNVDWWGRKVAAATDHGRRKELEAKLARAREELKEAMQDG